MPPDDPTPEHWAAVTERFGAAMDLPAVEREAFLADLRARQPDVAGEVASLLDAHDRPGEFLPVVRTTSPADLTGTSVGAYRLVRLIDQGGMGSVYLAERNDGAFTKQVALKVLSPAFLFAQERFQQEREFLARLDHPNLTRLLDGGTTPGGLPYLVVEYVEGVSITRYCAEHDLPVDARLDLLLQVCAGIDHAHQRFIVHSDIKPANILVTAHGTVKVLDFGIATLRDAVRPGTPSPATPAYSSPEQLSGKPLTTASDVYSIGVVAYEMLAGRLPFAVAEDDFGAFLRAIAERTPALASAVADAARARQLRGDLDSILQRALAKDAGARYTAARELAQDIERHRAGFPVHARPDTAAYRVRTFVGRNRYSSALAAVAAIAIVAGITVSLRETRVARRRFDDLRQLAHAVVFDVNDTLAAIPGTTTAREQVVNTALQYLDRLAAEGTSDPALREELAAAYVRIGKVQGGAFQANLGDSAGAARSFRKAVATIGWFDTTPGLKRVAIDAHINVAFLATDPIRSLPDFDAAIDAAERQLAADPADVETLGLAADACHGRATVDHVTDRVLDEEATSAREIELRRRALAHAPTWEREVAFAGALAQHALALEQRADYGAAVADLNRAIGVLARSLARQPANQVVRRNLGDMRSRAGSVLLAMGRVDESAGALEEALGILQPIVDADPGNAQYRGDLAYTWFRLAETRRAQGRFVEAMALHQRALAVRRARVSHDPALTFIRWDLSRSLNAVADLMLASPSADPQAAAVLFGEARKYAAGSFAAAPSFIELEREIARADEGLGRAARLQPDGRAQARAFLEQSLRTWEDIAARGHEDERERNAPARVRSLLASVR